MRRYGSKYSIPKEPGGSITKIPHGRDCTVCYPRPLRLSDKSCKARARREPFDLEG